MAADSAFIITGINYILKYIKMETVILNYNNISQYITVLVYFYALEYVNLNLKNLTHLILTITSLSS